MADDRLREADRTWRETGLVHDEARLLSELVRAGTIARERLELAAVLGYQAAVMAVGRRWERSHALARTFADLEPFGREAIVRAAAIFARRLERPWSPDRTAFGTLEAIENWCVCPCPKHLEDVESFAEEEPSEDRRVAAFRLAVRMAKECLLGARWELARWPLTYPRERDAVIVAAIREGLVPWALAPHPVRLREGTRGDLLSLHVGREGSDVEWSYLVDHRRFEIGSADVAHLNIEDLAPRHADIDREGDTYVFRLLEFESEAHVSATKSLRTYIASGDVLSVGPIWVEVRVLSAPYDHDVVVAREDAERLASRRSALGRMKILAAAACGHLGASLAASRAGLGLRPRFEPRLWVATLRRLPPEPSHAAAIRIAREVLPAWQAGFPGDGALERVLESGSIKEAELALGELLRVKNLEALERAKARGEEQPRPTSTERAAFAAGAAVYGALATAREGGEELFGVASGALDAGLAPERLVELIREEVLRWALDEGEPGAVA